MLTKFRYAPALRTISWSTNKPAGSASNVAEYSTDDGATWARLTDTTPQPIKDEFLSALYHDEHWRFLTYGA